MNNKLHSALTQKAVHSLQSLGLLTASLLLSTSIQAEAFDTKQAEKVFKKCQSCHEVGEGATNKVGPSLNGLQDKPIASVEGYKYSKAFKDARFDGLVWNKETLDAFLEKPSKYVKKSKMSFAGLKKAEDRKNIIGWLFHFDAEGKELSDKVNFTQESKELLGATAVAMTGDPDYGQYLSGECTTCHQLNKADSEIPNIVGWPKENFIDVMYRYKGGLRTNPVMETVAGRLGDEEMAALAAYFGSLENK